MESKMIPYQSGSTALMSPTKRVSILDMKDQDISRIKLLAQMYAVSSFNAGKHSKSEGDYFLIMIKSMSLGIDPVMGVDLISVIRGQPTLDAKGLLALVKASGLLEDISISGDASACTVKLKRKGESDTHEVTFTFEDAKRLGLVQRSEQYTKQPATMLKWRAVTAACREVFPDVIAGLYTPEEMAPETTEVQADGSMRVIEGGQAKPQLSDATSTPSHWAEDNNNVQQLLQLAVKFGAIESSNNFGADNTELLAFVGADDWSSFETGKDAAAAIKQLVNELQQDDAPADKAWHETGQMTDLIKWSNDLGIVSDATDAEAANEEIQLFLGIQTWADQPYTSALEAFQAVRNLHKELEAETPKPENVIDMAAVKQIMTRISEWTQANFNLDIDTVCAKLPDGDLSRFSTFESARKYIISVAIEQAWPIVGRLAFYEKSGRTARLRFTHPFVGESKALYYFKGREAFGLMAGAEWTLETGVEQWEVGNEMRKVPPVLLTWEAKKTYLVVTDATAIDSQ